MKLNAILKSIAACTCCCLLAVSSGLGSEDKITETISFQNGDTMPVEWLAIEHFEDAGWKNRWVVESQGPRVFEENGRLKVRLADENRKQAGVTVWRKDELPADVVIRVRSRTDAQVENNACNLNFFVHTREADGGPLTFGRSGAYEDYHQIPNHLFTFTGGVTPGWSRARRNPGFQLIAEHQDVRSEPGKSHEFLMVFSDDSVRYYLDGEKLYDYVATPPLKGGWFGLRTWFSQVDYDEVWIGRPR